MNSYAIAATLAISLLAGSAYPSNAQFRPTQTTTSNIPITSQTISNTIKCEVGEFAKQINPKNLTAAKLKVSISIISKSKSEISASAFVKLFSFLDTGAQTDRSVENTLSLEGVTYNIHPDNAAGNCHKRDRVPGGLGILACLNAQKATYLDAAEGAGSVKCQTDIVAKVLASAGGSTPIWSITVTPKASFTRTGAFTVTTVAPPPAK
ncbi:hypothetical protein FHS55_002646 [Angulomicrobium tetraedrale]|uniref:Uncharacterized protein n=1 Tax=Ancylobacter tetraedralis TaxID=217068 RepID=A0A839ZBD5_9HYPH|nr:hypothetical protein [Ancylobacter tetraedralis]MBB3772037.1 hypothetical protein [Ancylobacter tetraedralis]